MLAHELLRDEGILLFDQSKRVISIRSEAG